MLGRGETSRAFFTHSAKPSFYVGVEGNGDRRKQTVQCNRSMFKCGDKNVWKQQADVCESPFQQPTHSESIMSEKKEYYISQKWSLCTTQCSVFNAQPFDKTNTVSGVTHTWHTHSFIFLHILAVVAFITWTYTCSSSDKISNILSLEWVQCNYIYQPLRWKTAHGYIFNYSGNTFQSVLRCWENLLYNQYTL